jgi:outer membrane lipoprotein-sorting protein
VTLALMLAAPAALAQDAPDTQTIVDKTNHMSYYQGKDGKARVKMTITDDQNRTRVKEFTILRKDIEDDTDGEQMFYVYFHEPSDERGTVFMVHKHIGKDDDRWLYLPALDVVKRIAASDERTSFVGSHFFYEDVSGRGTEEDHHELVKTTDTYYVLKNTPKDPESVEFDSFTMYIHKDTFIPVKIEFEQGGDVYRTSTTLAVDDVEGYKTVTKGDMQDDTMGGKTVLEYTDVQYDIGLPEDLFTERRLRNPPMEYLK